MLPNLAADCRLFASHLAKLACETIDATSPTEAPLDPAHSLVSPQARSPSPDSEAFVIDCGGTNLRIARRVVNASGAVTWTSVESLENAQIPRDSSGHAMHQMTAWVMRRIKSHHQRRNLNAIAVVWSNGAIAHRLPDQKGITAVISGKNAGLAYNKGEWYLQQLSDGDDIGAYFLEAAAIEGIGVDKLFVGNDTICTACSGLGDPHAAQAIGGMIASTGANCTLLGDDLINPEIGGRVRLPASLLTDAEKDFYKTLSLEQPMAGKWLPGIFGVNFGKDLPSPIQFNALTNKDLNELITSPHEYCRRRSIMLDGSTAQRIGALGEFVIQRAGLLAGAMAYACVAYQAERGLWKTSEARRLMLDSTMTHFPTFLPTMKRFLSDLLGGRILDIDLVSPLILDGTHSISVPSLGAAAILDQLFAAR